LFCDRLDDLLRHVLPHVSLADGRKPKFEECLIYGVVMERGGYFPYIHWDTDWHLFPNADGFQLWYLLENDMDNEGNMFLVETPHLVGEDAPVTFVPNPIGRSTRLQTHPNFRRTKFCRHSVSMMPT